jgi:ornithine cyclodeaminase/alanine dehydrogenase-like protein (mu-crystallin family)
VLILSRRDVEELLDLDELVDAVADALVELSTGTASMPPRVAAQVVEREAFLAVMPAHLPSAGVLSSKLVTVFPHNDAAGIPSHQALIAAFDPSTGTPLAIMDATSITATRTAAGSALATRLLANEESSVLAILGTGVQARSHARALPRVMAGLAEVRVAGRDVGKAEALARKLAETGLPARAVSSWKEASLAADVVCATTHTVEPIVRRAWLSPGAHVNSVGFNPAGREVDPDVVGEALVAVESRASALAPPPAGAPDLGGPIADGLLSHDDVVELGELVAGTRAGRTSAAQLTLYRSVGVAVEDAAAAGLVLKAARERGAGIDVEI